MSNIIGFMFEHEYNDREYWQVKISPEDNDAILRILEKYQNDNCMDDGSIRGDLKVIDNDRNDF